MVELTAENGKTAKRTVMAFARDRKDRLAMKVRGTTASNSAEFMYGQMGTVLKENGWVAVDTDSALSIGENGRIKANGKKVLKRVMEYRSPRAGLVTKEAGLLDCKKGMALRSMPMEVSLCVNRQTKSAGKDGFATIFSSRY